MHPQQINTETNPTDLFNVTDITAKETSHPLALISQSPDPNTCLADRRVSSHKHLSRIGAEPNAENQRSVRERSMP